MLPAFNEQGLLPVGVHRATEEEVFARFATLSARRQWLGERLHDVLTTAKATGKLHRLICGAVSLLRSPHRMIWISC